MDDKLLVAFISGAAIVIAALITRESLNSRRKLIEKQEREKIVVEKGSEILPEISTRLGALISAFRSLVEQPFLAHDQYAGIDWQTLKDNMDARRTKAKELADQVIGLQDYHKRNLTWIPSELDSSIERLAGELIGHINLFTWSLSSDMEYAEQETDFLISQHERRKQIDDILKRVDEGLAEVPERIKNSAPLETETKPAAQPRAPTDESDARLDKVEDEIKRRIEEGREILKELGHAEDADKTSEDPLVQYDDKTREEVLLEVYEEYHAVTKKSLREWLDTAASEKLKSIQQSVRELFGVDAA